MNYKTQKKKHSSSISNLVNPRFKKTFTHVRCAKAIIQHFPDPIIVLNKNLRVEFANEAFCKMFKITDSYSKNFYEFTNNQWHMPPLKKLLTDLLTKKISAKTVEITHTFPSVGEKTLLFRGQRIMLDHQPVELLLLIVQDITKRKLIEAQRDDFVGFVTHELKTPFTSMRTFMEILQAYHTKTKDKKSQFLLEKASSQMKRLTGILNSFSHVYKIQTNKLFLVKESINMNTLVKEVIETFQYIIVTHEVSSQGTIKHWVKGDRNKIQEALSNLITNAIKYSPDADKVIVSLAEDEKNIIISVQDFGFGIPKEEQVKIFERFFRAKTKRHYNIKGLGLGLYIASQIIKQHKGKIWVNSTLDKGSTFFFSLPKTDTLLETSL